LNLILYYAKKNSYLQEKTKATTLESKEATQTIEIPNIEVVDEQFETVHLKHDNYSQQDNNINYNNPQQSSDHFEIQLETENYGDFEEVVLVKSDKPGHLQNRIQEQIQSYLEHSPVAMNKSEKMQTQKTSTISSSSFDEQLMREEVRLMAEKICWQIIPDITEKIVREEITKLLSNIDKSI
jgi:hypothetical protein